MLYMSGRRVTLCGVLILLLSFSACAHGIAGTAPPAITIEMGSDGIAVDLDNIILESQIGDIIEGIFATFDEDGNIVFFYGDGSLAIFDEDGNIMFEDEDGYLVPAQMVYDLSTEAEAYERPNNNAGIVMTPGVEGAIADGIILFLGEEMDAAITTIEPVEIRDLYYELRVNVTVEFETVERLTFSRTHGNVTLFVQAGDFVREGDLLANLSFEDEEFIINHRFAEIRLEQFDRGFSQTLQEREDAIQMARQEMEVAPERDRAAMLVSIQLMEADLQIFRRDMMRQREPVFDALYEINSTIAGDNIYAPFDGMITRTVRDGSFLTRLDQVITIVDHMSFYFVLNPVIRDMPDIIPANALINFGNVFNLRSNMLAGRQIYYSVVIGPDGEELSRTRITPEDDDEEEIPLLEFDIKIINDPRARGWFSFADFRAEPVDIPGMLQAIDYLEMSLFSFGDMFFHFYVDIHYGTNSMVIPRGAMRQGFGIVDIEWYVFIYSNGDFLRRFIVPGVMFRDYVQVLSGLDEDSLVVVFR